MQTNEVAQVIIKGKYITEKFSNQDAVPDDAEIMYEIRLNKFVKVNNVVWFWCLPQSGNNNYYNYNVHVFSFVLSYFFIFNQHQPKEAWEYGDVEERVTGATGLKEKGTKYFKDSKYDLALKLYTRGAELVNDSSVPKEKLTEEARSVRVSLHLNIAIVQLKLSQYTLAIKACEDVSCVECCKCTTDLLLFILIGAS